MAGLKEARADCEFCSYVIDVVEEGDKLKRTFDEIIWRLYLSADEDA